MANVDATRAPAALSPASGGLLGAGKHAESPIERPHPPLGRKATVADGSTFAPALRCLAAPIRGDVERLYRVLRTLDDLVDEENPSAEERVAAVERWAGGGRAAGGPEMADTPETRTLAELHERRSFPREPLLDFCAGMRHDIAQASVQDEEDFERYCQQAGGSVGIVLANLLGTIGDGDGEPLEEERKREAETKMATLGRAMQVTNILRDIDEDLQHGRVYIPLSLIERFGFPSPGARAQLLRELIAHADALYEQGAGAIPLLRDGRAAMALSVALYREILRQIERDGFGRRPGRAVVPAWRRQHLIARYRAANVLAVCER